MSTNQFMTNRELPFTAEICQFNWKSKYHTDYLFKGILISFFTFPIFRNSLLMKDKNETGKVFLSKNNSILSFMG